MIPPLSTTHTLFKFIKTYEAIKMNATNVKINLTPLEVKEIVGAYLLDKHGFKVVENKLAIIIDETNGGWEGMIAEAEIDVIIGG